jgi:hypothetical protein
MLSNRKTNELGEAEAPAERRREAIRQHDNQPNKRGAMVQLEMGALVDGAG